MIPEDHKDAVINNGINFLRSITEAYGSDEGLKLWDAIASTLDPSVKGDIFFAMLTGDHRGEITLRGFTSAGDDNYINIIKAIREVTSWGLKEAKDCAFAVKNGETKKIPLTPNADRQRVISNLRGLGVII